MPLGHAHSVGDGPKPPTLPRPPPSPRQSPATAPGSAPRPARRTTPSLNPNPPRPNRPKRLHLLRMPDLKLDQPHRRVRRRSRPALVFLERPLAAADMIRRLPPSSASVSCAPGGREPNISRTTRDKLGRPRRDRRPHEYPRRPLPDTSPARPLPAPASHSAPGCRRTPAVQRRPGIRVDAILVHDPQSSTSSPSIRPYSRTLPVTTVSPRARACPAISRSYGPIGVPLRWRSARIWPAA